MFSCFAPPAVPQGDPEEWGPAQVKAWLKQRGLTAKGPLAGVTGHDLKALNPDSLPADAVKARQAVVALQAQWAQPAAAVSQAEPGSSPLAARKGPLGLLDVSDDNRRSRGGDQTPRKLRSAGGLAQSLGGAQDDVRQACDSPSALRKSIAANAIRNLSTAAQGPTDFAEALSKYTPDQPAAVCQYILGLGKCGMGLTEALASTELPGRIFGVAYALHCAAGAAVVNRDNVAKLDLMAQDVLRNLDGVGPEKLAKQSKGLGKVLRLLEKANTAASAFTGDGWLIHMVCNEKLKEEFDTAHNAVVDELKACSLEVPNRAMARGDYRDANKAVRRTVKQFGNGNITQGLSAVECHLESAQLRELSRQLEAPAEAVLRELQALPRTDMPLEAVYAKMVQREQLTDAEGSLYKEVFAWYDRDTSGSIDLSELRAVLADLGMLDGRKPAEADAFIAESFRAADTDADGQLSFEEFCRYYDTLATTQARQQLRLTLGLQAEENLKGIFVDFCSFGRGGQAAEEQMDNSHFNKLLKDCHVIDANFTSTDGDIIFSKAKPKGGRKLSFEQFVMALSYCAEKKGAPLEQLVRAVLAADGPVAHATKADNVRLHDDKSTYTGVYAKGGPKVAHKVVDLASMLDRSANDVKRTPPPLPKGVVARVAPTVVERKADATTPQVTPQPPMRTSMRVSRDSIGGGSHPGSHGGAVSAEQADLYQMFCAFATFGAGSKAGSAQTLEMDGSHFLKVLRECGLLDKAFGSTAADLVFVKVKPKGGNKIGFAEFQQALVLVAAAKGVPAEQVTASVTNSKGPLMTPSKA